MLDGYALASGAFDQGLAFLFTPDFSKISANGVLIAMGHAFFTLSLGMGAIMVYGSYLPDRTSIAGTSVTIAMLDTLVALLAGLAIILMNVFVPLINRWTVPRPVGGPVPAPKPKAAPSPRREVEALVTGASARGAEPGADDGRIIFEWCTSLDGTINCCDVASVFCEPPQDPDPTTPSAPRPRPRRSRRPCAPAPPSRRRR